MAKEPIRELPFPQITEPQLEIWLVSPVTKAYLDCLEWKRADSIAAAGSGKLVDSSSADMTHGLLHRELGKQDGWLEAGKPEMLLDFYEMIFRPPKEEVEDG